MTLPVLAGIAVLGGTGAVLRLLLDGAVTARAGGAFPFGTLAVNLSGALALGVLAGALHDADALRLLATGLIGAFTTFSTWMFETHRLLEDGEHRRGALNVALSLVLGVALAWAGTKIGARL
ncbi:MAG: fluoride efflux transporter CrcB [Actinomycetota bacterium]|nr:fluoride efflux transporter CrcB [Actinomycetota bacterium]